MSPAADALANPTQAVANLYTSNKAQGIDAFPRTVTDHFKSLFASSNDFKKIPTLNIDHPPESFPNGSLVTFNCMIQDTSLSPELYLATLKSGECGGWGITDDISSDEDVKYEDLRECTALWAVSIPGLSSWCYDGTPSIGTPTAHSTQVHKYPIPEAAHIGVQIKIYDENIAKPLRTTDLVSFVGILTSEPFHTGIELSRSRNVATLHALFLNFVPMTIVPRQYPQTSLLPNTNTLCDELISWIADEGLGGDRVVAEWILLSLIARVRSRHPPVLPLSLTISNFPTHTQDPAISPVLYNLLSLIYPLVTTIPLCLATLNNGSFCPESKDEDLHSGQLQLPKGTTLVLNEGVVTEGGILNKGVLNIRAVQEMMKNQTLDYIFPYSGFQFETDVAFIILTEGKKSTFFETDVTIALKYPPSDDINADEMFYKSADHIKLPTAERLEQFRQLVGGAKVGNVLVGETVGKHIEEDFVCQRSNSDSPESGFTPAGLIRKMLVARLKALSLHQNEVTIENWESAKMLDK